MTSQILLGLLGLSFGLMIIAGFLTPNIITNLGHAINTALIITVLWNGCEPEQPWTGLTYAAVAVSVVCLIIGITHTLTSKYKDKKAAEKANELKSYIQTTQVTPSVEDEKPAEPEKNSKGKETQEAEEVEETEKVDEKQEK